MVLRTMITAVVAFALAVILTPIFRNAARRRGYLDVPNEASSHTVPTPRNGGFAIFIGITAAFGAALAEPGVTRLLCAIVLNALLPAVDELRPLPRKLRLVIQAALAISTVLWLELGPDMVILPYLGATAIGWVGSVLAIIWVVAAVNAYNFMDGLNGLSSTAAIICGAAYAILFWQQGDSGGVIIAIGVAAAVAGFLPWNLPSGSVFMGDVGSATLGFLLALLSLRLMAGGTSPVAALLPLMSFCSDALLAIVRRALKGERFFATRHRSHFYQWLNQQGWPHARVTGLWAILIMASALLAIAWDRLPGVAQLMSLGAVALLHAVVFAWVASRQRSA